MLRRLSFLVGAVALVAGLTAATTEAATTTATPFDSDSVFCTKSAAPPGTRNSSAPGVTPSSITIDDASLDTEALRRLGLDQMNFHQAFQVYFDEINKCGGINGRKIVLKSSPYNPVAPDQTGHQQAVCIKATEDYKALVVVGVGIPRIERCVSVNHKTVIVANYGALAADYRDAKGRLISIYPAGDRLAAATVAWMAQDGALKGKTIGVLGAATTATAPGEQQDQYVDGLKAKGYDVADLEILPCQGVVCTQGIGTAVRRMKAADVNFIVLTHYVNSATVGTIFRELKSQNIKAPVYGPDVESLFTDSNMGPFVRGAGSDGAQFAAQNGWYSFDAQDIRNAWRTGQSKETPFARMCTSTLAKATGQRQYKYDNTDIPSARWGGTTIICTYVRELARALYATGPNLTTERLVGALRTQRSIDHRDTGPDFHAKLWYGDTDTSPTSGTLMKFNFPCPLPNGTTTAACMLSNDRPARVVRVKG